MNVKQLKVLLSRVPDDALIVVPSSDHSYRKASMQPSEAELHDDGYISEYYGPENMGDPPGKVIKVVVIT